jgi:phytoene dehydrogenase-like protein
MNMESTHTVIIGAGLAGLACATRLARAGHACTVIEATDRVGGRVRTDHDHGFTLDHGFQVLLTGYPACRELLDYSKLDLCAFEPGALIRQKGEFRLLSDPWRRPLKAFATATNPVGSLGDKLRVAKLRRDSRSGSLEELYQRPQSTTLERLQAYGFSEKMINEFFRPFLGGVFLDESLTTSRRMLDFVMRMFASGEIAIPARGMSEIPRQLADSLPHGTLRLRSTVQRIESDIATGDINAPVHRLVLADETITCQRIVVATPSDAAARLLGQPELATKWSGTTNLYFAAAHAPDRRRMLMLRGDEEGPIQSAVVLSNISPKYAPAGQSLISVSVDHGHEPPDSIDDEDLEKRVRVHLSKWFSSVVATWKLIRIYRVPYALPVMAMDEILGIAGTTGRVDDLNPTNGIFVAGDHCETPSIQGAMNSGMRVADQILNTSMRSSSP